MTRFWIFMQGIVLAIITAVPVLAQSEPEAPEVILTVRHDDMVVEYALEDLQAMPQVEVVTTTIWTEGVQEFTGLPLHELVAALGLTEGVLRARAINEYAIDIPVADALEVGPIIAYLRNGEEMPVREKGPLWIVYPYDSDPAFQSELVYGRSIWQLREIEVVEEAAQ